MMFGGILLAKSRAAPMAYRAKAAGTSATVTKPSGVAVGDVVFVVVPQSGIAPNMSTSSGSAWTRSGMSNALTHTFWVFTKILDATDVSNTWSLSVSAAFQAFAWDGKGATTITLQESKATATSSLAFAGFTPARRHRGAVAVIIDDTSSATIVPPSGWTTRDAGAYGSGPTVMSTLHDKLGTYAGEAPSFTGTTTAAGAIFEVSG